MPSDPALPLRPGQKAPPLALPDAQGQIHRLADYAGRVMVLYFYPKDDTPGCTVQACDFTSSLDAFARAGAVVVGVSPDGADSHARFADKFKLRHLLLSDPDHAAAQAWGAWGLKKFMGREYLGLIRSTFVIDAQGRVRHALYGVKPEGHAAEILKLISAP